MGHRTLAATLAAVAATALLAPPAQASGGVRLIGERIVDTKTFDGTTVGGLSGIDFDRRTGQYVLLSDDRSDEQPARFYGARIPLHAKGIGRVELTGTKPLQRPDGTPYPPLSENDPAQPQNMQTVDPEEIRVDPRGGDYTWSQEGERGDVLIDPSVRTAGRDGSYRSELPLPDNERMRPETGPRQNEALEAFTYSAGGRLITTALEGALLQDGPAGTTSDGAVSRITVQTRRGHVLGQYAYEQEPVFAETVPPGEFSTNGVTSVLDAGKGRYLVLERSFVTGVGNKVRIFEIDLRGASNVKHVESLSDADVQPVRKRLVADLDDFGLSTVDNLEGLTWGPRLSTGERSLLLVSDDNFSNEQVTQVIALALR